MLCVTFSTARDSGADLELEAEPGVLEGSDLCRRLERPVAIQGWEAPLP